MRWVGQWEGQGEVGGTHTNTNAPSQHTYPHSPGRNPGTSTKVMRGMLNASQNLTNRAPFTEELMSRQPAFWLGWFPTTPTVRPFIRAKPTTMFLAYKGIISKNSPSSTTWDRRGDSVCVCVWCVCGVCVWCVCGVCVCVCSPV